MNIKEKLEGITETVGISTDGFDKQFEIVRIEKLLPLLEEWEKEIRGEERATIPVGFLRQWINEDRTNPKQSMVSNEDIIRFINIGYKSLTKED